jgi:hypothetical protein
MLCWIFLWENLIETWVSIVISTKFAIFGIIHQSFDLKNLKRKPCQQGYDDEDETLSSFERERSSW